MLQQQCPRCVAYVLFYDFWVSGLIFKSLISFEFIFVCGLRRWSSFKFLHISVQFSHHHLLNRPSLPHGMFLLRMSILTDHKGMGLSLGSV